MTETLADALEREHREIDEGIEAFTASRGTDAPDAAALAQAVASLRRHIYLEEEMLFPALRAAGLMGPVLDMLHEHGEMWRLLDDLVPRLEAHNVKEERILYPQADAVLGGEPGEELMEFMASGRMPQG